MNEVTITRNDSESKARYGARIKGVAEEAELTLSKVTDKLIIADHTAVPDTMRGMGVGRLLVERLIHDARLAEQKIIPLCPYVKALAEKHRDEWRDVIQW